MSAIMQGTLLSRFGGIIRIKIKLTCDNPRIDDYSGVEHAVSHLQPFWPPCEKRRSGKPIAASMRGAECEIER